MFITEKHLNVWNISKSKFFFSLNGKHATIQSFKESAVPPRKKLLSSEFELSKSGTVDISWKGAQSYMRTATQLFETELSIKFGGCPSWNLILYHLSLIIHGNILVLPSDIQGLWNYLKMTNLEVGYNGLDSAVATIAAIQFTHWSIF